MLGTELARTDTLLYRRGNFNGTFDDVICDAMLEERDAEIVLSPGVRWGACVLPGEAITWEDVYKEIRSTYDGPLAIATDLMAWNVTKDSIQEREVMAAERVQPPPTSPEYLTAKRSGEASMSEYILSGKWKEYVPPPLPER